MDLCAYPRIETPTVMLTQPPKVKPVTGKCATKRPCSPGFFRLALQPAGLIFASLHSIASIAPCPRRLDTTLGPAKI